MVLKSGGDDVLLALAGSQVCSGEDRLIIGLAAAGGEINFTSLAAQALGHAGAGVFQMFLGLLAYGVKGRGVAVNFTKIGHHGLQSHITQFGRCGIISINVHIKYLLRYLPTFSMGNCSITYLLCQWVNSA